MVRRGYGALRRSVAIAFSAIVCLPPQLEAADLQWQTKSIGGLERRFLVDRPDRPPERPQALLLALHGAFSDPDDMRGQGGFDRIANRDDFLFVFPEGTGPKASELSWNAEFCCRHAMREAVDDMSFLDFIVETIASETPVDRHRIYVSGVSNGALLAYRWG